MSHVEAHLVIVADALDEDVLAAPVEGVDLQSTNIQPGYQLLTTEDTAPTNSNHSRSNDWLSEASIIVQAQFWLA
jgi:hypothetical protein